MEMILVDWTRMGKAFCIAGVVPEGRRWKTVRPIPAMMRHEPRATGGFWAVMDELIPDAATTKPLPRNAGWSPRHLTNIERWDIVELMNPTPTAIELPHSEDVLVRGLRRTGQTASSEERCSILRATSVEETEPHFGLPLMMTQKTAYLKPGLGQRSLATIVVPNQQLFFSGSRREGADGPDIRVSLRVPRVGTKELPVKDHHLLTEAERAAPQDPVQQATALREIVMQMGPTVAVRLGLSRGFDSGRGEARCWLMADGFFSAENPQP